ncbi:efflux transporter outer membrane subunit [Novosphingobium sp. FSY-8]|uniref:Efflux transporter outer membrane subunit n=1 Tax=Novosphingobium ovatum TaxID=1908523 RepID=A0ABW9XAR3_9SPHN|nr:efflux transporter outer membrane subunit [Novosphingobium ovatum]
MRALLHSAAVAGLIAAPLAQARTKAPPVADIPARFDVAASDAALPAYGYAQVLADPRLVRVIDLALAHNQDLSAAMANVEAARAQARIAGAPLLPQIDASAGFNHGDGDGRYTSGASTKGDLVSLSGSVASYELDLFGRVHGLAAAGRAQYLAQGAAMRAARITLIANVANGWLQLAADRSLLQLAQDTAASARQSVALTTRRVAGGIAPLADQRKAELTLRQAEADIAAQTTAVAQDLNNLRLLAGTDVPADALPSGIDDAAARLTAVAPGLDSAVLLRRPDVVQAEFLLRAADANVDAARAALFPKITLTAVAGTASLALSSLFTGGSFAFGGGGTLSYPIFRNGALRNAAKQAQAQRDAATAAYRKAVQAAFTDVANVLARRATIEAQLTAQSGARDAAADNWRLTDRRYRGGVGTWLDALSAQQSLYAAEKTLVAARLSRGANLVALYRAVGGETAQ